MESKKILIFSGYNPRAIIAFLRTLEQNHVCDYVIVALSQNDNILRTKYADKVAFVRETSKLNFEILKNIITSVRKEKEHFFVIPSSEYLNRFLLSERKNIESLGCEIPLVEQDIYEIISDKETFNLLCAEHGLSVPSKFKFPQEYSGPFVAKPKSYFASDGNIYPPFLVKNRNDYIKLRNDYPLNSFFYEQFIEGENFYLLYYFDKKGNVYRFSQENLAQQPHGKSIVAAHTADIHKRDICKRLEMLFQELGFYGLVMVELRKCDGRYYIIEANPRLWGPSQLFVDAGCNFFEAFLVDHGLLKKHVEFSENAVLYFWNGGFCETWSRDEQIQYFNNGEEVIFEKYHEWIKNDIYRRTDTKELFLTGI